jgi:hypothetical protein
MQRQSMFNYSQEFLKLQGIKYSANPDGSHKLEKLLSHLAW